MSAGDTRCGGGNTLLDAATAASRFFSLARRASFCQHLLFIEFHNRSPRAHALHPVCFFFQQRRQLLLQLSLLSSKACAPVFQGWKCVSLHGDKSQAERTKAFNASRDKECHLLVATDVAARGVDLPNVEHVVNYTFPLTIEDYVHRIGRTGRGDSVGSSGTFFATSDKAHAGALFNVLQTAKQVPKDMFQFSLAPKRKGASVSQHQIPSLTHLVPIST
jgi:superfamily II DNA/RNA helicase